MLRHEVLLLIQQPMPRLLRCAMLRGAMRHLVLQRAMMLLLCHGGCCALFDAAPAPLCADDVYAAARMMQSARHA